MNRNSVAVMLAALIAAPLVTHCSGSPGSATMSDAGAADRFVGGKDSEADVGTREAGADTGTKPHTEAGAGDAGLRTSNCFASPGACGFPDPKYGNVGPSAACSSLKPSGSITVSKAGTTVENLNVTGTITVTAANVTIKNVCVSANEGGNINNPPAVRFGAPGGVIENSTVGGANATDQSVQAAIAGMGTASHVYFYNCGECIHDGPWTVNDSYIEVNAADFEGGYVGDAGQGPEDHHEGVYLASSSFVGNHDTIFNPHGETAAVFGDTYNSPDGVCANHITITDSLLAGGGYVLYTCASGTSVGASTMNISNNRFARCGTTAVFDSASGGRSCQGGADEHGYWPFGGYFGVTASMYCPPAADQTWSSNVWDDDGHPIPCGCLASKVTCYSDSDCCSSTCTLTSDAGVGTCI
jgi:hypothetical protein